MNTLTLRLRCESGIALVMALMMITVLTIVGGSMVVYSTQGQHESNRSKASDVAYRLAETGVNNAVAVLGLATNNATQQSTLPSTEPASVNGTYSALYEGGRSKWWGVYDGTTNSWVIYGKGIVTNTNAAGATVTRTLSASVRVTASMSQPLNTQAWNYWYATNQGGPNVCDVTFSNNVEMDAPFYIQGNLCFSNNTKIVEDLQTPRIPIIVSVLGKVQFSPGSSIGRSSSNTVSEVHIAGGCGTSLTSVHTCKKYPTSGYDPIYTPSLDSSPVTVTPPVPDWTNWYNNASPGPFHACNAGAVNPPVFDNNTTQDFGTNGSVTPAFNLTPATNYSCTTANGSIAWNATTKTLTVSGVIYIDGSVAVTNGAVNDYQGQATMLLSGSLSIDGMMCGKRNVGNTDCDFTGWNPNTEMLIVATHASGTSISLINNAKWEGGVWAAGTVALSNNAVIEGPTIGGTFTFSNNAVSRPFPTITSVPLGAPGNPTVYAQPNPPGGYSG
jgi:Tfp pilus assembly protein PilX